MATLEELYKLRKIFRDYEAPIPEKLKKEIREKETPYLKELNEKYSSIAPKDLPVKELSEKVLISLKYDGGELKAVFSCGLEDEPLFLDDMIKSEVIDEPETSDEEIEEEGEGIEKKDDEYSEEISEPEEIDEDEYITITRSGKGDTTPFKVIFLDEGKTIIEKNAIITMVETLKYMGLERVSHYKDFSYCGYPLVGKEKRLDLSKKGKKVEWQKEVDGWFIYAQLTNDVKKSEIEKVAKFLDIRVKVVDIPKI